MFDVRAIANFILDLADQKNVGVSNMALNKIIYFIHSDYLVEKSDPLVSAKIEAWQHGPVFREIYHEFKNCGDQNITTRALKLNFDTGEKEVASIYFSNSETIYISALVERYIDFSAAQLRALSHREGSPWHQVWDHSGKSNPRMKISNDLIKSHYSPGALQ